MKAVIQAGGRGTRLQPYTTVLPKPLMPVGEQPVIELLLKWLRRNGVSQVFITTGYLGHLIKAFCGDGRGLDMEIQYSDETEPLGTVGALNLVAEWLDDTFLVVNGDLITDLSLREFKRFHQRHGGPLSVATTSKAVHVDMGVIHHEGDRIVGFQEKPTLHYRVNMGMYLMQPSVLDWIPRGMPFGFDHLMHQFLDDGQAVHAYHHEGRWLDIGRPEDFKQAQEFVDMLHAPHRATAGG